ncbi:MAG: DegT/DnrJ/EryC1/StrS family aminotransferase [Bacteroidota bacterium]
MIPVFRPCYGEEEIEAVREVLKSGWVGLGPRTKEFEDGFAEYAGVKYAVALNSCTAALHLAMKVMAIEDGEVITTPMTFVSTNHAILYNNAKPVFCDIEPDTLNIDASKIEELVTEKTKAIIVMHYGGYACDVDPILDIAKRHNLKVIEDAAHGCGGEYKGRKLGSLGDIGCFSFHAVKNLATGEGGMITTDDPEVYGRLMKLRWMGITKDTWSREEEDSKRYSWYYDVMEVGYKYHMNDIPAAIGLVQLRKLHVMNSRRREISQKYTEAFSQLGWIEVPVIKDYMTKPACHNYVIKVEKRDELNDYLKGRGISTGVHYYPNHLYDMYKPYYRHLPIAQSVWKKVLTIPLFPDLTDQEIDYVVKSIAEFDHKKVTR